MESRQRYRRASHSWRLRSRREIGSDQRRLGNELPLSISRGERLATYVVRFCGSIAFVWMHFLCFGVWIFINTSTSFLYHPDPFPFTSLTFAVVLESIFLSSFIRIRQRHETQLTEQRSHLDLQLNLQSLGKSFPVAPIFCRSPTSRRCRACATR